MRTSHVIVVGAGIAGLVAAVRLAIRGIEVTVLERADGPGGKLREIRIGDAAIDSGPTVFTMRWVFERIFREAGARLSDHLTLRPLDILARHAWDDQDYLDLFADIDRSADAIGRFAGSADAREYRAFCDQAKTIYETLEETFIDAPRPTNPVTLAHRVGMANLSGLFAIKPFSTMWRALRQHFRDDRLRQLFGRYATYCGSSPYEAPATLMLVAHVEQSGVWRIEGGMFRLAKALEALGRRHGVTFRYGTEAREIIAARNSIAAVETRTGERIEADAIVVNADAAAVASGLFGQNAGNAVPPVHHAPRSLSAVTWSMVAETDGFPLAHHSVFFSGDYKAEFDDVLRHKRLPRSPTVYVCAQDRGASAGADARTAERLFFLVNAPPSGDAGNPNTAEVEQCEERTFAQLERCGLRIRRHPERTVVTTPTDFEGLFPATGGALYGQASHGWQASFRRPGCRTKIPGLYLAGGSTHPGPGIPMAALSGWLASESLMTDTALRRPSVGMAISGGISTR